VESSKRQKLLLIAAGAGVLLLVLDSLVLSPLVSLWQDRQKHLTELRESYARGTEKLKRQDLIQARWDGMRTNTLPGSVSQAESDLLKSLDRWRQASGVGPGSTALQWKQASDDYLTLECRTDVTGTMDTLARFLYEMQKGPLGLKIEEIDISSHDNEGQQLSLGLQVSGLMLTNSPDAQQSQLQSP
jgi:hypothetical protein